MNDPSRPGPARNQIGEIPYSGGSVAVGRWLLRLPTDLLPGYAALITRRFLLLAAGCLLSLVTTDVVRSATFDPQEYAGKVVILDFWASWCVPCRRSFPWLNTMHEKYSRDGLVIVGVNLDMEHPDAERFLAEYPAKFRIVYDDGMTLAQHFEVMAMPSSFVIGRDGEVVAEHLGFKVKKQDEYEAVIRRALGISEDGR